MGAELTRRARRATAVHAVPAVLPALLDRLPADRPLRTAVVAGIRTAAGDRAASRAARGVGGDRVLRRRRAVLRRGGQALRTRCAPFPGADDTAPAIGRDLGPLALPGHRLPGRGHGPLRRDADGFATVGDLADRGPTTAGWSIRGRGDAAITTGGVTVIAEDVEDALGRLPGVRAVAVVGLPHGRSARSSPPSSSRTPAPT